MGRGRKPYTKECFLVQEMAPGTTKVFYVSHVWGLTHRLRAMLKEKLLSDSYTISTDSTAGAILVYRKVISLKDYDDVYKQGELYGKEEDL